MLLVIKILFELWPSSLWPEKLEIKLSSILSEFSEQLRQQKRAMNKTQRDLGRDKTALERQEKQLVSV